MSIFYEIEFAKYILPYQSANQDEIRSRIEDMAAFLKTQSTAITQFDDHLVRQLIETITVFEDSCTVEFKSGVTVDVEK